ncbi:Peptidoglycan-binding protein, CsiV [Allopseudospirillum japonicum]|uniref:Peptidoglycan-binding protein, CsiV n=1 Tax=Allopseudospirillum japonicum TaxID=64971 RepID=A0A1H6QE66_9GAMM|nr:CsiV family protein [Allopseudospirillum japonicum]SEI37800.1 Peptidoglycan-binding protein, CsiV [Allopseudospirillum japonicum]
MQLSLKSRCYAGWQSISSYLKAVIRLPACVRVQILTFLGLALLASAPLWASNAGYYQVEMLIFTQPQSLNPSAEGTRDVITWSLPSERAYQVDTVSFWQQQIDSQQISPLTQVTRHLTGISQKLQERSGTRILWHQAWGMHIGSRTQARPILIEGGRALQNVAELQGYVNLSVGRYLHVHTNLGLHQFEQRGLVPYSAAYMQQKRRMRSNEIHYLDNPYFGVLIQIRR